MKFVSIATHTLLIASLLASQVAYALPISERRLNKVASSEELQLMEGRVIIDNDTAFLSKLKMIQNARKSIDMVYYIYANDYSSSVITKALMDKARSKVKVRLLVDYLTNLKQADLLLTMQNAGIEIRLYNRPTENIKRDAIYITTMCPKNVTGDACVTYKENKIANLKTNNNGTDFMSRIFLTGLYSKNPTLLQTSVVDGQEIDLEKIKDGSASANEQQKKQLQEFTKLLWEAKIKGSLFAKFKLWLAFKMYGEELTAIYNIVSDTLPISLDGASAKDWMYLSDYTHHKLLLVDAERMQLGGRNIEDSYHMKTNDVFQGDDKKYIFIDTDFSAKLSPKSGSEVQASFDRLWNLNFMVSTLDQAEKEMELDSLSQIDELSHAITSCRGQHAIGLGLRASCIETQYKQSIALKFRAERIAMREKQIIEKANQYWVTHKINVAETDAVNMNSGYLSAKDLQTASVYYIENLPFARPNLLQKLIGNTAPRRQHGAKLQDEYRSNKNIHDLFVRGLENVCKSSQTTKEIILHNAYFFPSPNVMRAFGNMINGTWNCAGVKVTIITNSYSTTDLFPVNAFASTQFKALFSLNREALKVPNSRSAQFRIIEYTKSGESDDRSLHSKVSLLGNDMIIGSANMDIRSYAMDTNNGVYIKNAKDLTTNYRIYVNRLINGQIVDKNGKSKFDIVDRTEALMSESTVQEFIEEQVNVLQYAANQYKIGRKFIGADQDADTRGKYLDMFRGMLSFIHKVTLGSLDSTLIIPERGSHMYSEKDLRMYQWKEQIRLEKMIQDLLSTI